jgi:hypothetical protein
MVFFLPTEYRSQQDEEDEEEAAAHLVSHPQQACFNKLEGEKHRHLKAVHKGLC